MAANVEVVTVSNSTPKANENAEIAPRSAPEEQVSKLGSGTKEPQQLDTLRSLFMTGPPPPILLKPTTWFRKRA
jgi:hypothetical protein